MIEIMKQLPFHPGTDDLVQTVISQSFRHFEHMDPNVTGTLRENIAYVSSLYAELVAVIAQSRFQLVRRKFLTILREIRPDATPSQSPMATDAVVALLLGMQYVRIKPHPIEELESCCQFLRELAEMLVESKEKEIKLAIAGLLKSMLLPFAATVKNEVNVPVLRDFVSFLYPVAIDMAARRKYAWQMYQLVTCLLAVSQKTYFLQHWPPFLALCLQQLKTRDTNVSRHALESIYRLAWVYTVRLRCESNSVTITRMQTVVNSLFPKGAKVVCPRDMAVGIFARIIQFVAHERLDFAMREIVFDLLCVGKPIKILTPERMNIGIRAFLLISDSRQQKETEPPLPYTTALPSGPQVRPKKNMLTRNLTMEDAKNIGLDQYYESIINSFEAILRLLDTQIGRPFMLSRPENWNLTQEEAANMLSAGDRKPKLALFCACLASIPRLLPPNMLAGELIDLLSRLTLHMDREISQFALQAMQILIDEFPTWRVEIISGYIRVIEREIPDGSVPPELMDQAVRRNLLQLLQHWKSAPASPQMKSTDPNTPLPNVDVLPALRAVEAFCLVVLCQSSPFNRRFAILLLREVRSMAAALRPSSAGFQPVVYLADALDRAWPAVLERLRLAANRASTGNFLSGGGSGSLRSRASPLLQPIHSLNLTDLTWATLAEKTAPQSQQSTGKQNIGHNTASSTTGSALSSSMTASIMEADAAMDALNPLADDPWFLALGTLLSPAFVYSMCPDLRSVLWNSIYTRIAQLAMAIDIGLQPNTDRSSSILSRSSSRRPAVPVSASDRDSLHRLWLYYLTVAACVMPHSGILTAADYHIVTDVNLVTEPDSKASSLSSQGTSLVTVAAFLRLTVPLLRSEVSEVRLAVANALGCACPLAVRDLLDELMPIAKEALERKQENPKRRRRRDSTRLLVLTILCHLSKAGVFSNLDTQALMSASVSSEATNGGTIHFQLMAPLVDLLGAFTTLLASNELDSSDPDVAAACRLRYADSLTFIIEMTPEGYREEFLPVKFRSAAFDLLCRWADDLNPTTKEVTSHSQSPTDLRNSSVHAICLLLSCGPCWKPNLIDEYVQNAPFYLWLEKLLRSHSSEANLARVAFEAIILMLDYNPEHPALLHWLFDRCYAGQADLAETCFAVVAARPDWPGESDPVSFLCLALANLSSSRAAVHLRAAKLLDKLQNRIAPHVTPSKTSLSVTPTLGGNSDQQPSWLDLVLTSPMSNARVVVTEKLATLCPRLTISMFSEITHRVLLARTAQKRILCQVLQPWLRNLRLIHRALELALTGSNLDEPDGEIFGLPISDSNQTPSNNKTLPSVVCSVTVTAGSSIGGGSAIDNQQSLEMNDDEGNALEDNENEVSVAGWGSAEATELVLNNLIYVTLKFYDLIPDELSQLWVALADAWPGNIATIIRYLMALAAISGPILLPTIRTIVRLISFGRPQAVVDCLSAHLQCHQPMEFVPERCPNMPYFRLQESRQSNNIVSGTSTISSLDPQQMPQSLASDQLLPAVNDGDQTVRPATTPLTRPTLSSLAAMESSPSDDWLTKSTTCASVSAVKSEPQPLPLPAFGGYHAPLSRHLPEEPPFSSVNLSRSALAMLLLPDLATDGLLIGDWTAHLPYLMNLITLTVDDPIALLRENSKRLLLGLIFTAARQATPPNEKVADLMLAAIAKLPAESKREKPNHLLTTSAAQASDTARSTHLSPGSASTQANACFEPAAAFCSPTPGHQKDKVLDNSPLSHCSTNEISPELAAERILTILSRRSGQPLWPRHMASASAQALSRLNGPGHYHSITATAFESLRQFVTLCASLFGRLFPDRSVADRWAQTALHLGTNPPPVGTISNCRQVACRALRIYQALQTPLTGRVLVDVAGRLAEVIADPSDEVQQYALELTNCLELGASMPNLDNEVVARLVWITAAMLESDVEIELMAALRLIDVLVPSIIASADQIQTVAKNLRWPELSNTGILGIIHKAACSSSMASAMGFTVLCRLAPCATFPAFTPAPSVPVQQETTGLVLYTASLLPFWLQNYSSPTPACREAADTLATLSVHGWDNLGVVLTLYSRQSYTKDVTQWCRCVVKYLMDVCPEATPDLLALFTRLLESPLSWVQRAGIEAAYHLVSFSELGASESRLHEACRSLCRLLVRQFSTGPLSKEAQKLLRLFVSKSAAFQTPPSNMPVSATSQSLAHTAVDFDTVLGLRRDLPGRTLEFDFDPSRVVDENGQIHDNQRRTAAMSGPQRQLSVRQRLWHVVRIYGEQQRYLPRAPSIGLANNLINMTPTLASKQTSVNDQRQNNGQPSDEQSVGRTGSIDETSMTEQQFTALRNFDFLYDEMDDSSVTGGASVALQGVTSLEESSMDDKKPNNVESGHMLRQSLSSTASPPSPGTHRHQLGNDNEHELLSDEDERMFRVRDDDEVEIEVDDEEDVELDEVDDNLSDEINDKVITQTTDEEPAEDSSSSNGVIEARSSSSVSRTSTNSIIGSDQASSINHASGDDSNGSVKQQVTAVEQLLQLRKKHQSSGPVGAIANTNPDAIAAYLQIAEAMLDQNAPVDEDDKMLAVAQLLMLLPRVCRQATLRLSYVFERLKITSATSERAANLTSMAEAASKAAKAPDCPLVVTLSTSMNKLAPEDMDALIFGFGEVSDALEAFCEALKNPTNGRRLTVLCSSVVAVCSRTATFACRSIGSSLQGLRWLSETSAKVIVLSESADAEAAVTSPVDDLDGWDDANLRLVDATLYVLQALQLDAAVFRQPPSSSIASAQLSAAGK